MNCGRCKSLLSGYCDDRLEAERRTELDAHVAECTACADDLRLLAKLSAALRAEPAASAPAGLADRLTRGALGAPTAGELPSFLDRWMPVAWPAAAASAVAATSLLFILGSTGGVPALVDEDPVAIIAADGADDEDDTLDILSLEEE